jgi:carbon monoxide dehydrogenase subunit G
MAKGTTETSINRSADDVWKVVRDFGGLAEYMPGIDKCEVDGDVRTLEMMGIQVKEQLHAIDDTARSITYSIVESPMTNLEFHQATITITPDGAGSRATWAWEIRPDELNPLMEGSYSSGVAGIKSALED